MAMSPQKREMVSKIRRKQILDSALDLFVKKGFEETTIQDIAEDADISKGLIYRYFSSKNDILDAFEDLIAQCRAEIFHMPTATGALRLFAERLLLDPSITGYRPPLRVYVMCYMNGTLNPELKKKYFNDRGKLYFGPIIKKGQDAGEFRQGDPTKLGELFWRCLLGYTATLMGNQEKYDYEDIDLIMQILK